jgi:hypothetical protein
MPELLIGTILFFLGFVIIVAGKRLELGLGETSKVALLVAPLMFYLLLTGKFTEFEALGFKTKLKQLTRETTLTAARAHDLAISYKEAADPDFGSEALWQECRPFYVITDKVAKDAAGKIDMDRVLRVASAIRSSIVCGQFKMLIVVDRNRKPVGYFGWKQFIELLRIPLVIYDVIPTDPSLLFNQVMATELGVILHNPEIRAKSPEASKLIIEATTNLQNAYRELLKSGQEEAVFVDRFDRFDGIITRSVIEGRIVTNIIEAAQ